MYNIHIQIIYMFFYFEMLSSHVYTYQLIMYNCARELFLCAIPLTFKRMIFLIKQGVCRKFKYILKCIQALYLKINIRITIKDVYIISWRFFL